MPTEGWHRTLIAANRTASTDLLLQEVKRRAAERPTEFALLIPDVTPKKSADWTLETALTLLRRAVRDGHGAPEVRVEGLVGGADAFESIKQAVATGGYDDVIISTLPKRSSKWLRRDLPRRVQQLRVPVIVITPGHDRRNSLAERFGELGSRFEVG